ncbi:MAG: hypothetical protein ABJQ29_14985 [Luteolibacter sp.]
MPSNAEKYRTQTHSKGGWTDGTICSETGDDIQSMLLGELEQHLKAVDVELSLLSRYGFRSGVDSIDYRTQTHEDPNQTEWIKIHLKNESVIDEIVLVPTIWRDSEDTSITTVATHIRHIYEKLGVQNAPAAINKAYSHGIFSVEQ